jgi:hypothetical protein
VQNWDVLSGARSSIKQQIANDGISEMEVLRLLAQAAVDKSNPEFKDDVRSRKFTIVNGTGIVNQTNVDVTKDYGITDANYR